MVRARRFKIGLVMAIVVVALVVVMSAVTVSVNSNSKSYTFTAHPAFATTTTIPSIADVAEKVLPSVVNIASSRLVKAHGGWPFSDPFFRHFFGHRKPPEHMQRGLGSGVILEVNGIVVVVTNNHVVEKADEIKVKLSDGREFEAKVVGTDPKSDLAVLKLKGASKLKPLKPGDSARLRLGDIVLAVGNPFGLEQTVTMGIVSAKGRANLRIVDYEDFIQTDAAINPGNSGGALVDMNGHLVGINTAILSRSGGYQGIGFAIPTNMARPILSSLLKLGKVVRGYLGVMIQDVDDDLSKAMKLPGYKGVLVSDTVADAPARKAGIRRGDFIVKVNGQSVPTASKLRNLIASLGSKRRVSIDLYRDGKKKTISVVLGELPSQQATVGADKKSSGMRLGELTPETRRKYNIPSRVREGIVVEDLDPSGKAAQVGLRPGDVILRANRVTLHNVRRFSQIYAKAKGRMLLLVYRDGSTIFLLLPK